MCWIAPLIPQAMYRSGAIRSPVWPIWSSAAASRGSSRRATRRPPPPSSAGQLLELREALRAADAATATDDDLGVRRARRRHRSGSTGATTRDGEVGVGRAAARTWRRPAPAPPAAPSTATACGATVSSFDRRVERRVLEQAAGPALAGRAATARRRDLDRRSRPSAGPSRAADVGHHLVAAVAARGDDDRCGPRGR